VLVWDTGFLLTSEPFKIKALPSLETSENSKKTTQDYIAEAMNLQHKCSYGISVYYLYEKIKFKFTEILESVDTKKVNA